MKIASLISFALAAVACLSVTTEAGYKHKHVHSWKHDQCTALGGIISHDVRALISILNLVGLCWGLWLGLGASLLLDCMSKSKWCSEIPGGK